MKGNREFFEELYRSEYDNIKRYVRRMVTDDNGIEDIVQETFVEAYRKIAYLRTHPNIPGWLRVTAKNKIMKWEEKQKKYSLDFDYVLKNTESGGKGRLADDLKWWKHTVRCERFCQTRNSTSFGIITNTAILRRKWRRVSESRKPVLRSEF